MEPVVPETHRARALVWGALAASALGFAVAPAAPGRLALVADTAGCRLDVARPGLERCACERTPLAVREALGLPAALNALGTPELERISGLGPVRAGAIAGERARGGPFATLEEVSARVPGIGAKTVDRIRPRLFVAGPDPACGGSRE
ncbi:MAG TPA: helix-hairpin-helix domain-containing protein [Myxococcota bacterium]|nr:helix-hairpin-helix domain-containing protein [Myxococcota bacterium]